MDSGRAGWQCPVDGSTGMDNRESNLKPVPVETCPYQSVQVLSFILNGRKCLALSMTKAALIPALTSAFPSLQAQWNTGGALEVQVLWCEVEILFFLCS